MHALLNIVQSPLVLGRATPLERWQRALADAREKGERLKQRGAALVREAYGETSIDLAHKAKLGHRRMALISLGRLPASREWIRKLLRAWKPRLVQREPISPFILSGARERWLAWRQQNDVETGRVLQTWRRRRPSKTVAEQAGISVSTLHAMEQGRYGARNPEVLARLATALGSRYEEMFAGLLGAFREEEESRAEWIALSDQARKNLEAVWESGRERPEGWQNDLRHWVRRQEAPMRLPMHRLPELADRIGSTPEQLWPFADLTFVYMDAKVPPDVPWPGQGDEVIPRRGGPGTRSARSAA
jgi:hypothetical protein